MKKLMKIIESCKNIEQLKVAERYSFLWLKKNGNIQSDKDFIECFLKDKKVSLSNE